MARRKGRGGRGHGRSARKRAARTTPHPRTAERRGVADLRRRHAEDQVWDDISIFGVDTAGTTRCMLFKVSTRVSQTLEEQYGRAFARGSFVVSSMSCRTQIEVFGPVDGHAEAMALAEQRHGPLRWTRTPPDDELDDYDDDVDDDQERAALDRLEPRRMLEEATLPCRSCGVDREEIAPDELPDDFPAGDLAELPQSFQLLRCPCCGTISVLGRPMGFGAFA